MDRALLDIAIKAALDAGQKILEIYNNEAIQVQRKADDSPLTQADVASHHIILEALAATNIPVLSEEGRTIPYAERKHWERLWIVDPIDGTKEFIKHNGEFTVNIALIENQKPLMGVIYAPVLGDLYFSSATLGAFKIHLKDHKADHLEALIKQATALPVQQTLPHYTVVASRSHRNQATNDFISQLEHQHQKVATLAVGSSLKLCMVAEGKAQCYPRCAPTMEWDTAAGQAICEAAGFQVLDWETQEPVLYNREVLTNGWFLVR